MAICAAISYALCNSAQGEIGALKLAGIFYFSIGILVPTSIFLTYQCFILKRGSTICNFRDPVTNELNRGNILTVFLEGILHMFIEIIIILNFGTSNDAHINIGIISCLWALSPFFTGIFEYVLYG